MFHETGLVTAQEGSDLGHLMGEFDDRKKVRSRFCFVTDVPLSKRLHFTLCQQDWLLQTLGLNCTEISTLDMFFVKADKAWDL